MQDDADETARRATRAEAPRPLRTGYTTGTCATAAALAAARLLWSRAVGCATARDVEAVDVALPRGGVARLAIAELAGDDGVAQAGVVKDAGDDPDVTHGALIRVRLSRAASGAGLVFRAGEGVGWVTKPGLPLAVGEPAINPAPRAMIRDNLLALAGAFDPAPPLDLTIEISVPGGAALAAKTWNPRLGIVGGISILGTTGVVKPYSCAAWIASIHRGIDVVRASGGAHALAATGSTSEAAARARLDVPEWALLDMGDFAGGLLKYLRDHPIPRLTIAGGFAKLTKLGQGAVDLHSDRSQVDFSALASRAAALGLDANAVAKARTAMAALGIAGAPLAQAVAEDARAAALGLLRGAPVAVDVLVVDRGGRIVGEAPVR